MKIRFISYGYKFYEAEGKAPPSHDFLFSLRDLPNPYWDLELRPHSGLDDVIKDFFKKQSGVQDRLQMVKKLTHDFIVDFCANENRSDDDVLTFAFRCTGGKHRSVYFAESVYQYVNAEFAGKINGGVNSGKNLEIEIEHIEMHRYVSP